MHDTQNLPPQNLDAEMSILGGILIDNDSINRVLESIVPEDFYREVHRKILLAMMHLSDKREPCDLVTLTETLKMKGELDEIGGAAYLLMLVDYVPTAANITYYCNIVKKKSFFRRLIRTGTEITAMGYAEQDGADDLLESALIRLTVPTKTEPIKAEILVVEAKRRMKERYDTRGQIQGIPYGFSALDAATCGMHRGELIVVAGRPSMGKTAAALNIGENASESGYATLIFSLEMDRGSIVDRVIASRGGIRYGNIRSGNLQQVEWAKYARCSEAIAQYRLVVDDTPAISLGAIRSKARKQKMKEGLDLIIIDYLQLITVSSKENRTQAIGELSRGLKQLARELGCAVVLLSQLNRAVDGRPDKRPTMSDLRDSGEIEQDADVILFPFRHAAYCQKCKDRITLHLAAVHC